MKPENCPSAGASWTAKVAIAGGCNRNEEAMSASHGHQHRINMINKGIVPASWASGNGRQYVPEEYLEEERERERLLRIAIDRDGQRPANVRYLPAGVEDDPAFAQEFEDADEDLLHF